MIDDDGSDSAGQESLEPAIGGPVYVHTAW
jgi:hypothetical protein